MNRQVDHLQRRLRVGVLLAVPRELANHAVDRLNRIGRVDRLADRRRVVEQRDQVVPLQTPLLDNRRILRPPHFSETFQFLFRLRHRRRLVDPLEVGRHRTAVLVGDVLQRRPHQVHDAQLHLRLGIGGPDRLGEARQAIDADDEDVTQPSILQVGQTAQPELRALGLR